MRILFVEDEKALARALTTSLEKQNFMVVAASDGKEALMYANHDQFDLIILDIMLPEINGFEIVKSLRENKNKTPILLLSALSATDDKIRGLNLGADDYLTKPFSFEELLARIYALLRRSDSSIVQQKVQYQNLELNLSTAILSYGTRKIELSSKEFNVMEILIKRQGSYVSKDIMMDVIWGYDSQAEYNAVEVYISFLRKKLVYLRVPLLIKVSRGIGYKLDVMKDDV